MTATPGLGWLVQQVGQRIAAGAVHTVTMEHVSIGASVVLRLRPYERIGDVDEMVVFDEAVVETVQVGVLVLLPSAAKLGPAVGLIFGPIMSPGYFRATIRNGSEHDVIVHVDQYQRTGASRRRAP